MIVGSGTVATFALTGYAGATTDDADDDGETTLSSDLESVLELVPAESTLDASYQRLQYVHVENTDDELDHQTRRTLDDLEEVDPDTVSDVISVVADDGRVRLSAVTGSFDRPDIGGSEEDDNWLVGDLDGEDAFAAADGKMIVASGEDANEVVQTAVDAVHGDADSILASPEETEPVFERLESMEYVTFFPNVEDYAYFEFDGEVSSFAVGFQQPPMALSGTTENEYVVAAESTVDDDWLLERIERIEQGQFVETTVDRSDGFVHVEAVVDQPPERDRDAAPDASVRARADADEGVVTFEHADGETIDTENLEVWKDGELADDQPADDHVTFAEGDRFELETGPLADVGLRWFDESEDVYYYYDTALVGRNSFETSHDIDDDTVEITYVGELEADPARLELVHRDDERTDLERRTLDDVLESLTTGDSITVDDVTLGDRVSLELSVPANPNRGQRSLARHRVRPPRMFISRRESGVVARYHDDQDRDADEFRVLVDDETASVQFTDETDTLSAGDEIELGDVSHGSTVTIEWLEPDEPTVIEETVVYPYSRVDMTYDDASGTVTVDYEDGDEIDADDLELRIDDEPAADQPADEYDTFEPGDELTTAVDPFATAEFVWEGPDDTEHRFGQVIAGRESLDAAYDPDAETVELVYTGEQSADPESLSVDRRDDVSSEDDENLFAQEYDTLTTGDSVVIEDVGLEERITVMLVQEGENHVSRRSIFRFRPEPQWAFTFSDRDDGLVAVYREESDRDAANFELLADGEPADVQPSDRYDTLTRGDELAVGEFEAGTELVIQWIVPDEPREIRDHVVVPEAEFEFEYHSDDEEVTVEHAGGDEIAASELGVIVEPTSAEPSGWDEDGMVTEGDSTTVDAEPEGGRDPIGVAVVFREQNLIDRERIED
ncbi:hypothetical protein SAMN04489842_1532 [Natronobacterium texcoconense]|uniref:Uncharacterized protein n=2 Tax=Natronobacterium texcoconense TaxID=1095778 RepID=A0A1H1ED50_NATTX|nr:hypothetical protein SAMN04489842_1532 [Natronobacterium texcoconense]